MTKWLRSLRLTVCISAGVLVLVSFKISQLSLDQAWLCAVTVMAIACATMVHNDWRDRRQDAKRGKRLAHDHPGMFFIFLLYLWKTAVGLSVWMTIENNSMGLLAWLMIISGLIYSEIRKIPMMPILFVCVTGASAALFPVFAGHNLPQIWMLFLLVFIAIFVREISTDLRDISTDVGYKWTLPQKLGIQRTEIIIGISVFWGLLVAMIISPKTLISLPFVAIATFHILKRKDHKTFKIFLDMGIAATIFALLV